MNEEKDKNNNKATQIFSDAQIFDAPTVEMFFIFCLRCVSVLFLEYFF